MRFWPLLGILAGAVLLQTTLAPYLTVRGLIPDLLLAVVVTYGLLFGLEAGLFAGMGAGLLLDVAGGRLVGLSVLSLGVAGLLAGVVEQRVYKDNLLLPVIAGFLASVGRELITALVLITISAWEFSLWERLWQLILPGALYNALICVIIYFRILRHYHYFRPDPRGQIFQVRKR